MKKKRFKRIFKRIIIIIILAIICFGISKIIANNKDESKLANLEGTISNIDYKVYQDYDQGSMNYPKRGVYTQALNQVDSPYWYIIAMGEQKTGGYRIEITDIKIDKDKNVEVIVKEKAPNRKDDVTQALTYPACCLKLSGKAKTIVVKNTKGEVFKDVKDY